MKKAVRIIGIAVVLAVLAIGAEAQDNRTYIPLTFTNYTVNTSTATVTAVAAPATGTVIAYVKITPASNLTYSVGGIALTNSPQLKIQYNFDSFSNLFIYARDVFFWKADDPVKGPFLTKAITLNSTTSNATSATSAQIELGTISGK